MKKHLAVLVAAAAFGLCSPFECVVCAQDKQELPRSLRVPSDPVKLNGELQSTLVRLDQLLTFGLQSKDATTRFEVIDALRGTKDARILSQLQRQLQREDAEFVRDKLISVIASIEVSSNLSGGSTEPLRAASANWTSNDLSGLKIHKEFDVLNLGETNATDDDLRHLSHLTVRVLYLPTGIGDEGLAHIAKIQGLERLFLSNCQATDAGLSELAGLTNLSVIEMSGAERIDGRGLAALAKLPLEQLYLPSSIDVVFEPLIGELRRLKVLSIQHAPSVELGESLSKCGQLELLQHRGQKLSHAKLVSLQSRLPNVAIQDVGH